MPYEEALKFIKKVDDENEDVYEYQGKMMATIDLYEGQHSKEDRQFYS